MKVNNVDKNKCNDNSIPCGNTCIPKNQVCYEYSGIPVVKAVKYHWLEMIAKGYLPFFKIQINSGNLLFSLSVKWDKTIIALTPWELHRMNKMISKLQTFLNETKKLI